MHQAQPGERPQADKRARVCTLRELDRTTIADGPATTVGITVNLADVHVDRVPAAGRARFVEHVAGASGSLRKPEMLLTNERVTTVIEDGDLRIAIVQIASRLVRRIVTFVTFVAKGDVLHAGQRIGAIRSAPRLIWLSRTARRLGLPCRSATRSWPAGRSWR